jgi:hypothetical protein
MRTVSKLIITSVRVIPVLLSSYFSDSRKRRLHPHLSVYKARIPYCASTPSSTTDGLLKNVSVPEPVFGKAMTSRMVWVLQSMAMSRSKPVSRGALYEYDVGRGMRRWIDGGDDSSVVMCSFVQIVVLCRVMLCWKVCPVMLVDGRWWVASESNVR